MEDCKAGEAGDRSDAVNIIIWKLRAGLVDESKMDNKKNVFWDEWKLALQELSSILKGESSQMHVNVRVVAWNKNGQASKTWNL
jgi:hypothetical protein